MARRKREGGLTPEEKRVVKALLAEGWRNQDIQALVNIGRAATVNSARITGVKVDDTIRPAMADEVSFYKARKQSFDWNTGLNLYDDERLIRAREAMILAVQVFNNPSCSFKTEIFAILANIAWTYLLHEFYLRKKVKILDKDGRSLLLSQMLERHDCPLSTLVKKNLGAIKAIRDEVEHLLLRKSDLKWAPLFQACCLNFDKTLITLFGAKGSLQNELSLALQFSKLDIDQTLIFQNFEIPEEIAALDARLHQGMTDEQLSNLEYQFRVIYTLDSAAKSAAGIKFIKPDTDEAKEIKNVLVKYQIADEQYPHKPSRVVKLVSAKTGKKFLMNHNTQAWYLYKVRPPKSAKQPENTNKDYCIYHPAHGDYTYSDKWIAFLCDKVASEEEFNKIKAVKL
jgi:hypothetical protein